MFDLDLGTAGLTSHYGTARDVRAALEDRSSDPVMTAFSCLVAPSKFWVARLLNEDERRELGEIALERYCESRSVSPADYADLIENIIDPFAYEWQPGCRTPSPVGCST